MQQPLHIITDMLKNAAHLSETEKELLLQAVKEAKKNQAQIQFKLDRVEKDRDTISVMLEETIDDLQKKTKAVEAQNRELEIETSLERVRTVALSMSKPDDMLDVCRIIAKQLELLNVKNIRNVQTAIIYKEKGSYLNYEYYIRHHKTLVTDTDYRSHPDHAEWADQMLKDPEAFHHKSFKGKEVKDWFLYQQTTKQFADPFLSDATSLDYYWYSMGPVALGMSTYSSLTNEEIILFKRFRNVFELAYRRFLDIEQAHAQAREAQIEFALERIRAKALAMYSSNDLFEVANTLREQMGNLGQAELESSIVHLYTKDAAKIEAWYAYRASNDIQSPVISGYATVLKNTCSWTKEVMAKYDSPETEYTIESKGQMIKEWYKVLEQVAPRTLDYSADGEIIIPEVLYYHFSKFSDGALLMISEGWPTKEAKELQQRAAKVFDFAYRRYLDLKQAETQAREAQIEAALERIRSISMAIRKSSELMDIIHTVFGEWKKLGLELYECNINLFDRDNKVWTNWGTGIGDAALPTSFVFPWFDDPFVNQLYEDTCKGISWQTYSMGGEDKQKFLDGMFAKTDFKNAPEQYREALYNIPELYLTHAFMQYGSMDLVGPQSPPEAIVDILKRFAKVFEQAYTRYLDVVQAEAQARESQVQLSLERVRASTMAMHKSNELPASANLLFHQVHTLGVPAFAAGYCIWEDNKDAVTLWMSSEGVLQPPFKAPTTEDELFIQMRKGYEDGKELHVVEMGGEQLAAHYQYMRTLPVVGEIFDSIIAAGHTLPTFQIMHYVYFSKGFLLIITYEPVPQVHDIFIRFAKVFEQTYTRFLDLQKAEAQAREAQIEVAVERVRAKSLAMYRSEDLHSVIVALKKELLGLHVHGVSAVTMYLEQEEGSIRAIDLSGMSDGEEEGSAFRMDKVFRLEETDPDLWIRKIWNGKEKYFVIEADEADFDRIIKWLYTLDEKEAAIAEKIIKEEGIKKAWLATVTLEKGKLNIDLLQPPTAEIESILIKMGAAFDLAYTRFLDLQKAEAQAREAQIELGLERVRARAMAMQKSHELKELISTVSTELGKLDIVLDRCFIITYDIATMDATWWMANPETPGEAMGLLMKYHEHPPYLAHIEAWKQRIFKWQYILEGETKKEWDKFLFVETELSKLPPFIIENMRSKEKVYLSSSFNNFGYLSLATLDPLPDEQFEILLRFAKVFDLTFTRFNDLQKAEAQAREAQIEAALERVRSRTLAMQKSDELAETAAVLFQQLIALGIEPNRLYISIIKSEDGQMEFWITDEDGSKVSTAFATSMKDNATILKMFEGWEQQQKSLVINMQGIELQNYFRHLTSLGVPFKGGLQQKKRVQEIAYFSKGFIGMASPDDQPAETLQLLERFAAVFNLTFTRFNDLKIAEAHAEQAEQDLKAIKDAKQKAEETLTELQATQKQLIQSEKMASLGELTAGIAHEIQNPLNFVNNFSEVSKELLDEMKEAIEKGDPTEAKEIMNDVIQNLEKINHHGKRADAIVKGMLQHSRSSSNQKEPTDINALADEYLRLAYHGLRAKDKSFNATMKTDFDESIGKVNIIPQDIGRVILNLITNAFYVVKEKSKQNIDGYEPTVTISTSSIQSSLGRSVEIKVSDNGGGIPQKILDKIFQPFFSTKPTGQGTGLGLSLSYDIVKAHSGELNVETKEAEGSTFTISLPA